MFPHEVIHKNREGKMSSRSFAYSTRVLVALLAGVMALGTLSQQANADSPYCCPPDPCPECPILSLRAGLDTVTAFSNIILKYSSTAEHEGVCGWNWVTPLDERLIVDGTKITHYTPTHAKYDYTQSGPDTFTSSNTYHVIKKNPDNTYTLTEKDGTIRSFDEDGKITAIEESQGFQGANYFDYNASDQIIKARDEFDRYVDFTYTPEGKIDFMTDYAGKVVDLTYDANGDLVQIDFPDGRSLEYSYTPPNEETPELGHNLLQKSNGDEDVLLEYEYTGDDRKSLRRDALGETTYDYDQATNVLISTDPEGNIVEETLDPVFLQPLERIVYTSGVRPGDPAFYLTEYEYNSQGVLTKTIFPKGNVEEKEYDVAGNLLELRKKTADQPDSPDDIVSTWTYNTEYNVVKTATNPVGKTITHYYDFEEETLGDLNGDGITTSKKGLLVKTEYPEIDIDGVPTTPAETLVHNNFGQVETHTDPQGNSVAYAYIDIGIHKGLLETKTISPGDLDLQTSYTYDAHTNIATITDPEGNIAEYTYDERHRVIEMSNCSGCGAESHKTLAYDANGNLIQEEVENLDENNVPDPANPWITTTYVKNELGLTLSVTQEIDEFTTETTSYEYDSIGRLSITTDPKGNKQKTVYDERGLVYQQIAGFDSLDQSASTLAYDDNGNLAEIEDPRGNATTFINDLFDRREKTIDALGNTYEVLYCAAGSILKEQRKDDTGKLLAETEYEFDDLMRQTKVRRKILDDLGNIIDESVTETEYNLAGTPAGPGGCVTCGGSLGVGGSGMIRGNVIATTDPRGNESTLEYDSAGRLITHTDPAGNETHYTLDGNGRSRIVTRVEQDETTGGTETFVTENIYDPFGRVIKTIDNAGNETEMKYDGRGNLVYQKDAELNETRFEYDGLSRRTKTIDALSNETTMAYDLASNLETITDANNNTTSYVYDAQNRLISETMPDTKSKTYTYDVAGNLDTLTDQNDNIITNTYDDLNRLTRKDIQRGQGVEGSTVQEFAYDGLSRMITATDNGDPLDLSDDTDLSMQYDSLGRLVQETQNGYVVESAFDKIGNRTSITGPSDSTISYAYTALSQINTISKNASVLADYDYVGGRVKQETFGNGVVLVKAHDNLARTTSHTYEKDAVLKAGFTYAFDKIGNKLYEEKLHDPANSEIYNYDITYRLNSWKQGELNPTKTDIPDPVASQTWQLDGVGNWDSTTREYGTETRIHNEVNELIEADGPMVPSILSPAVYHLDDLIDGVQDSSPYGNDGSVYGDVKVVEGEYGLSFEFDGKGDYVEIPSSPILNISGDFTIECVVKMDKLNQATLVGKWDEPGKGQEGEKSYALTIQGKRLRGMLSADGSTETVAIISNTKLETGKWMHIAFVRSGSEISLWVDGVKDSAVGYYDGPIYEGDGPLRIASADAGPDCEFRGKVDEVRILNIAKTSFGDLLRQEFDDNGNLIDDGIFHYFWDALNRLVKTTLSSDHNIIISECSYDALNRRVQKTVSNSGDLNGTTRYIYSGWQVIEERDGSDNLLRSYTYGNYIDEPITMTDSTDTYYYHTNTLYSVAAVTDSSGDVVEQYRYTPYGKPTILDGQGQEIATSAIGNAYLFTGRRLDPETGMYYYRYRYYSAELGRFVSRDPIGYVDGMNLYRGYFVPNMLDPSGKWCEGKEEKMKKEEDCKKKGKGWVWYPDDCMCRGPCEWKGSERRKKDCYWSIVKITEKKDIWKCVPQLGYSGLCIITLIPNTTFHNCPMGKSDVIWWPPKATRGKCYKFDDTPCKKAGGSGCKWDTSDKFNLKTTCEGLPKKD